MAKNLVHLGWRFARRLFTALGAAGLVTTSVSATQIPSPERLALESRVQAVRQTLQDSAPQFLQSWDDESLASQWGNWGNWGNWANAWNNWGNWGNA
jgi:hypothetical protein